MTTTNNWLFSFYCQIIWHVHCCQEMIRISRNITANAPKKSPTLPLSYLLVLDKPWAVPALPFTSALIIHYSIFWTYCATRLKCLNRFFYFYLNLTNLTVSHSYTAEWQKIPKTSNKPKGTSEVKAADCTWAKSLGHLNVWNPVEFCSACV